MAKKTKKSFTVKTGHSRIKNILTIQKEKVSNMIKDIIEPLIEIGYEILDTIFEFEENQRKKV